MSTSFTAIEYNMIRAYYKHRMVRICIRVYMLVLVLYVFVHIVIMQ